MQGPRADSARPARAGPGQLGRTLRPMRRARWRQAASASRSSASSALACGMRVECLGARERERGDRLLIMLLCRRQWLTHFTAHGADSLHGPLGVYLTLSASPSCFAQ